MTIWTKAERFDGEGALIAADRDDDTFRALSRTQRARNAGG